MKRNIHQFTLDNGLEIAIYPIESVSAVSFQLGLNAGSSQETYHSSGALHFLEHMLLIGSVKYPTAKDIAQKSEELATNFNGRINSLDTRYWFFGPSINSKEIISFAADILLEPLFDAEAIENTKNVITTEHASYWSNPDNEYGSFVDRGYYGERNPYVIDPLGTLDIIQSITKKDLTTLYEKYYQPQNIKIVVAGNVDVPNITKVLTARFSKLRRGKNTLRYPKASFPKKRKEDILIYNQESDHVRFNISFPIEGQMNILTEDLIRDNLGSYAFGGSYTSPLYSRLRHELGIVYNVNAVTGRWPYTGRFGVNGGVTVSNLVTCVREIKESLKQVKKHGLSDNNFERSRRYLDLRTYLGYSDPENIASRFLGYLLSGDPLFFPQDYEKITSTFKKEEIDTRLASFISFGDVFWGLKGNAKQIRETGILEEFEKFRDTNL